MSKLRPELPYLCQHICSRYYALVTFTYFHFYSSGSMTFRNCSWMTQRLSHSALLAHIMLASNWTQLQKNWLELRTYYPSHIKVWCAHRYSMFIYSLYKCMFQQIILLSEVVLRWSRFRYFHWLHRTTVGLTICWEMLKILCPHHLVGPSYKGLQVYVMEVKH